MPSLRELLAFIDPPDSSRLETAIRERWPAERVYIAPMPIERTGARTEAIRQTAKRFNVRVAAEVHGVTPQYVYRIVKK